MLKVEHVTKSFPGIKAVDDASMEVSDKERRGIVGPNGSGKTTLINLISGMLKLDGGSVFFDGERIDHLRPHEIVERGVGRTFQIPKPFRKTTVLENILVPMVAKRDKRKSDSSMHTHAREILDLVDLKGLSGEYAGNLSGGQQKLLEIGRIIALDPKLFLIDEPTAAVHAKLRSRIADLLLSLKDRSMVIVSHDLNFVRQACTAVTVMNAGQIIAEGDLSVLHNREVIEAYMGG